MKKPILLLITLITFSLQAQIENGRYSFKKGDRRQIIEITDSLIMTYSKRSQMQSFEITEKREIEGVHQIICDIENGNQIVVSQTMNGKNLFYYKRTPDNKPASNLKYWYVKKKNSNRLRKLKLSQTKVNW